MLNNKIICFDIDGVICKTHKSNYKNSKPNLKVIKLINKLYKKNKIILFTSRFMGRNNNKISLAKKEGYKFTVAQLREWGLKYHVLKFGKPSYDIIIDDKSIDFSSDWTKKLNIRLNI